MRQRMFLRNEVYARATDNGSVEIVKIKSFSTDQPLGRDEVIMTLSLAAAEDLAIDIRMSAQTGRHNAIQHDDCAPCGTAWS